jgi:hypothetical protein
MLEMDIKPWNIILYVYTVDILIRISFPLPNFLPDNSPDFIGIIPTNLKMSPNGFQFVNP